MLNDWCCSIILNCYKGKDEALDRNDYRGLKLLDENHRMDHNLIRKRVTVNEGQLIFLLDKEHDRCYISG